MVTVRLARFGAKKRPYYHIVVTDSENRRDGRFIEQIGTYDPRKPDAEATIRLERLDHWLTIGAKMSDRVAEVVRQRRRAAVQS